MHQGVTHEVCFVRWLFHDTRAGSAAPGEPALETRYVYGRRYFSRRESRDSHAVVPVAAIEWRAPLVPPPRLFAVEGEAEEEDYFILNTDVYVPF